MSYFKTPFFALMALSLFLGMPSTTPAFKGMGGSGGTSGGPSGNHGGMAPQSAGAGSGLKAMSEKVAVKHGDDAVNIVALINGTEITMGSLMSSVMEVLTQKYGGMEITEALAKRIRYEALERLAMEELASQRAAAQGVSADPEVVNAIIETRKKQAGGEEAYRQGLAQQNKTEAGERKNIEQYLAVKQIIQQEVNNQVSVDQDEIDQIYRDNKDQFAIPERTVITDIIFFLDPEDKASTEKVAFIRQKLDKELDKDPSRLTPEGFVVAPGKDIALESDPELYEAAIKLKKGDLSLPLIINGTFHLILLEHHQPRRDKSEKQAKASIVQKLKSSKRNQLLVQWRQGLLKGANIEIVHELLQ